LVSANALEPDLAANIPHDRILHGHAGQLADLGGCRPIVCVAKSMNIGKVCQLHTEGSGISVHFLDEVLDALIVRENTLLPIGFYTMILFTALNVAHNLSGTLFLSRVLISCGNFIKILAKVFGQNSSGIISTR
jgi:hypothetical protein